jgi:UDP-N-acetylglucosamine 2-epimerase (non-hydrolysing)
MYYEGYKMKICIILGTRPEIIKMSSLIRECEKQNLDYFILHSNQHYSKNLDEIFFKELELPFPKYNLNVGSGLHGEQTGKMLIGIEKVFIDEKPDIVLVQGDTNTVLAGALVAAKLHIKIGHLEAGMRSFDKNMPEEVNRILTDHCSDILFVPTSKYYNILINEGIAADKIFLPGDLVVDVIQANLDLAEMKSNIIKELKLMKKEYFLVTFHRPGNVDNKENLGGILGGLSMIFQHFKLPIICSIHPRTEKQVKEFGLKIPEGVIFLKPLGYLDFLKLEKNARVMLTDSGGIQEEACLLKVPCVTLRENTEWIETLEVKSNILAGTNPEKVFELTKLMALSKTDWKNPFGDSGAAVNILKYLTENEK